MALTKNYATHATYVLVGSFAFWLPSLILHALGGPDFSFRNWRLLACVQTFATLAALVVIWFPRGSNTAPRKIAPWMLLGIWILGPFWLFINATFIGGGFAKEGGWLAAVIAILLFPVMTPLLSIYEGSIGSLLVITLLLGLVCIDLKAILSRTAVFWRLG